MKSSFVLLSACALWLVSAPAQAFTIGTVAANGNVVDTSFSTASALALSIDAQNNQTVSVQVLTDATDAAVLPLSGLVRNLIGQGIPRVDITLVGATFANLGGAQGNFGSVATVSGGSDWARISLAPAEMFEVSYGDWFLDGAASDFGIRWEGNSFTVNVTAVPEPASLALLAAGLGVVGAVARRRSR